LGTYFTRIRRKPRVLPVDECSLAGNPPELYGRHVGSFRDSFRRMSNPERTPGFKTGKSRG